MPIQIPKSEIRNSQFLAFAIVLVLAALAAWPFLTRPGLPRDTDAELHVFRAAQLGEALRGGVGYVRWAPDLWYGYGYPIFNYYSPLTYYVANLFTWFGLDLVNAVKAVFVLGLLGAAAGMYVLVRENWGARGGVIAAAAYVFSPYVLFIDPQMRGDLAEFAALALFPWLLWAFRMSSVECRVSSAECRVSSVECRVSNAQCRVSSAECRVSKGRAWLGVVLWAALILTHALMALILSAMLVMWIIWQFFSLPRHALFRRSSFVIRHSLLALGLSAIYWLPFVLERNAVHLSVVGPGQFDFHNHFVAWRDLLAASPALDLGASAPRYIRNLGLAQWGLALLAIPLVLGSRRESHGRLVAFFFLCSSLLILLMLSPSAFVWEHVPLMPFIQFPWRLLGPAAAMLAVCAGAGVASVKFQASNFKWVEQASMVVALLSILALALPTMYPPMWGQAEWPLTPRGILNVELHGNWLGTTSTGDFVPAAVKSHPPANPDLIASYERGQVDKFDRASLPQGASAYVVEHGPARDRFTVTSPQPFTARVLTFDFPGWRAWVDGQPAPITPSDPHGFITFPIPAGSHDVRVEFGATWPRTLGALISGVALAGVAWLAIRQAAGRRAQEAGGKRQEAGGRTQEAGGKRQEARGRAQEAEGGTGLLLIALSVVVVFAVFKIGFVDRCETCFRVTSPPGQALGAQVKLDPRVTPSNLANVIALLGFDLPQREVRAGGSFPLTLYWQATAPAPVNYQVFVHLGSGQLWGQPLRDKLNPGDFPTMRWTLDKYVWDDYVTPDSVVLVKPDAPPGEHEIRVGLYTLADGKRAPVLDAAGRPAGDSIVLPIKMRVLPSK